MLKLINGHGLEAKTFFNAETQSLNLGEKDSSSTLTVGPDAPEISAGDWIQDMEEPGKGIVWRVRSVDRQYNTGTRTITLEHLINTLQDRIIPNEAKPQTMGGSSSGCSARQAISYIMGFQSDWRLGSFAYDSTVKPYKFDGDTLKAALDTVSGSLEDPIWEYDFSSYPFKLSIKKLSDDIGSEMRGGRNLQSVKYTIDRSRMYTRFYATGKNNIKLPGGYISRNESKYGRIDHAETDQSRANAAELQAWAEDKLRRHAEPNVTVSISGLDLSAGTGEPLDQLTIGKRCRVPMPESGEVINEKITKLSWRDKIKDRESVTVTLANALEDVANIVAEEKQKGGKSAKAAAKAEEDINITIGDTRDGLYTVIRQTSTNIINHVYDKLQGYSTIEQTAAAISLSVSTAKSDMWSLIQQTATSIYIGVKDAVISITNDNISLAVGRAKTDLYSSLISITSTNIYLSVNNAKSEMTSAINVQADRISLVVQGTGENAHIKPAAIVTSINGQTGSSKILLSADQIDIDGVIDSLEAKDVMIRNFNAHNGEFTGDLSVLGDLNMVTLKEQTPEWKSFAYDTFTYDSRRYLLYAADQGSRTPSGSTYAYPITAHSSHTIYYLGHD